MKSPASLKKEKYSGIKLGNYINMHIPKEEK
jgi:hypothetical protein